MQLTGYITGTLGYSLKRELLANAIAVRDVETFTYEVYSIDFAGHHPFTIQDQISQQWSGIYAGDVRVTVFDTDNSLAFPSDGISASRFSVSVEIKKPITDLATSQPELGSGYYSGLGSGFWSGYGPYLLDFKEGFGFSTSNNGNRQFTHDISFSLQTGLPDTDSAIGRQALAQTIASGIFSGDKDTTFGIATMISGVSTIADPSSYRSYYTESYDLLRNQYAFGRRREIQPFDNAASVSNFVHSVVMDAAGMTDVTEKGTFDGWIDYAQATGAVADALSQSFARCSGIYTSLYNTGIMLQEPRYSGQLAYGDSKFLPLVSLPIRTVKTFNANAIKSTYEITYTNNPTMSASGMISQNMEFSIGQENQVEATHSFDITINRVVQDSSYVISVLDAVTGASPTTMGDYYAANCVSAHTSFPGFNLVKQSATWPNIRPRATAKFVYSNNPTFFVSTNGVSFNVLDYSVDVKKPVDIVNEFKIINRPTKSSVLSYGYQTEQGEVVVAVKAGIGKQNSAFAPSGFGSFRAVGVSNLGTYIQAIAKFGGQIFLQTLSQPMIAFNWFLSDSKYSFDSEGNLNVTLNYVYALKKRSAANHP